MFPSFAHPWVLVLLAAVPVVVWRWRRGLRPAVRFPHLALFTGLPRGRAAEATLGRQLLPLLALGCLIVAAAEPRVPDRVTPLPVAGVQIVLVLDVSGSMAEPMAGGTSGSRLEAAKQAFRRFVAGDTESSRVQDRLGLVTFAEIPRTVCPPTLNHDVLLTLLGEQTVVVGPGAGTSIGDAVAEALSRLEPAQGERPLIVVISDGEDNLGAKPGSEALSPRQAAQLARALEIPVYTLHCAGTSADRSNAERMLADLARLTGGLTFDTDDDEQMHTAFETIDERERTLTPSYRFRRYQELSLPVAWVGVAFLTLSGWLDRTRWRVAP